MKQDSAIQTYTPTPWIVGEYSSGTEISADGGRTICFFAVDRHDKGEAADESKANARYLVHCVNHFNFIVDELKVATRELEHSGLAFDHPVIARLHRALATAEGRR